MEVQDSINHGSFVSLENKCNNEWQYEWSTQLAPSLGILVHSVPWCITTPKPYLKYIRPPVCHKMRSHKQLEFAENHTLRIRIRLILENESGWATPQLHPALPADNCRLDTTVTYLNGHVMIYSTGNNSINFNPKCIACKFLQESKLSKCWFNQNSTKHQFYRNS